MIRGLFGRLLVVMCGVATASTGLAVLLQERSLSADLERAAEQRLDSAAAAAERLLQGHLEAMAGRYRAVSGTPQLRATLEVNDAPTLAHYARNLLEQNGAARVLFESRDGGAVVAAGEPGLDAQALAVETVGLVAREGRPFAVVATELAGAGRLVAVEPVEAATVAAWSELCGARVSFVPAGSVAAPGIERLVRRVEGLEMRVASSLEAERAAMRNARLNLGTAAALGLVLAFGVSLLVSRGLVRPIQAMLKATRRIGAGDLTAPLESDRADEIGDVARAFEEMRRALRGILGHVTEAADRVDSTSATIAKGTQRFVGVTAEQQRGNDEAAATLQEIRQRMQAITAAAGTSAHSLDLAVDGSSESFKELAQSGELLAKNAARLRTETQDVASTLEQLANSAAHVAVDSEALLPTTETTALSVGEMAGAAQSVNEHIEETARLSSRTVAAADGGRRVVREAVHGMDAMLRATQESEQAMRSLRERAEEIGSILTVIDDVTTETGLLALNASIIASQAGEHGKAFAVVAGQMKALSDRVQASTQEIGQVVRAVQGQVSNASESIERGSASARSGAELIGQAETALDEIARAAEESGARMSESAQSTAAQVRTASAIAEQMEAVREGMERIRAATQEQAQANILVQRSSDALKLSAAAVHGTLEAQTGGTQRIGESVEAVQHAVRDLTRGLEEQWAASQQVAEVVERSREYTRSHEDSAEAMEGAASDLAGQAEALREAVRRFRL